MRKGIVIHSHTGNTLHVASEISGVLTSVVEKVEAENEDPNSTDPIVLTRNPSVEHYDFIVFGAPVRGFSLSPVMKKYLEGLDLTNKTIFCFVTQHLKSPMFGGNRAVKQMKKLCESKGGEVMDVAVVNWSSNKKDELIKDIIIKLSKNNV